MTAAPVATATVSVRLELDVEYLAAQLRALAEALPALAAGGAPAAAEPLDALEGAAVGFYRDKDGDAWEVREDGVFLRIDSGTVLGPSSYPYRYGTETTYAPFTPIEKPEALA